MQNACVPPADALADLLQILATHAIAKMVGYPWSLGIDTCQALTSILNNEAALDNRLSGLDTPAPIPGQKHLHLWRLQLMKRPVHNKVELCQLCYA